MSFNDCKISESQIQTTGVQSQPDTLTGSAADNKMVFDALPTLVIQKLNSLIDQMQQQAAAGQVGVTPFDGMTAQTLQDALEQIQADIGGNYSGADGAGKVGYTPSEGVDEDTVQEAIEAVQANLTAYIAKIKAATGAAEVGNAPIAGMTATNVQQALEELRENIDNIVSGIIPGGSITSDMLQDGAVTADKLGSDVTGEEIPTSASDPTSISSQLSNAVRVNPGYGNGMLGNDLNNWKRLGTFETIGNNPDPVTTNAPPDTDSWGVVTVLSANNTSTAPTIQLFNPLNHISGGSRPLYYRFFRDVWTEWRKLAFATPPQEFDLPLAEGFSSLGSEPSTYWKNQFGEVTVILQVKKNQPISDGEIAAYLPAGFSPSMQLRYPCLAPASRSMGFLYVYPNGGIAISFSGGAFPDVLASFTFLAAN